MADGTGVTSTSTALLPLPVVETRVWRRLPSRVATFCLVEIQRLRHDRTELMTRAVQPVLWPLIYCETFNRLHAIPTGSGRR